MGEEPLSDLLVRTGEREEEPLSFLLDLDGDLEDEDVLDFATSSDVPSSFTAASAGRSWAFAVLEDRLLPLLLRDDRSPD